MNSGFNNDIREAMPMEVVGDRYFCEGECSTLNALVNQQSITSKYEIRSHTPLRVKYDVKSIKAVSKDIVVE